MARHVLGRCGALWGVVGVIGLLGYAVLRLFPLITDAFTYPFQWYHWAVLVCHVALMAYTEGYRGFQQGFSPRVVARARYLAQHPRVLHVLLGPLFCMGYVYATWQRRIRSVSLTVFIVLLVVLVTRLDQPWRGIIDAGVVIGLLWGCLSIGAFSIQALRSDDFGVDPEVPQEAPRPTTSSS